MCELTQDYVRSLFDYRDGELYWKKSKAQCIKIGDLAGHVMKNGYRMIGISGKMYFAHRLIFLYHHGDLPEFLDHIDGNRSNNDISNLREATGSQNQWNRKKNKSMNGKATSSDFKGVSWCKDVKKWRSRIKIKKKSKHLGHFTSEIEAALAYDRVAIERDGEFALTNAMMFPEIFKAHNQKVYKL